MTDNVPSTDAGKAREGLIDELETINNYEEMASKTSDPKLRKQFEEITDDERVHVGNFAEMISEKDPKAEPMMREGLKEAKEFEKTYRLYSIQEMMCGASHFEKTGPISEADLTAKQYDRMMKRRGKKSYGQPPKVRAPNKFGLTRKAQIPAKWRLWARLNQMQDLAFGAADLLTVDMLGKEFNSKWASEGYPNPFEFGGQQYSMRSAKTKTGPYAGSKNYYVFAYDPDMKDYVQLIRKYNRDGGYMDAFLTDKTTQHRPVRGGKDKQVVTFDTVLEEYNRAIDDDRVPKPRNNREENWGETLGPKFTMDGYLQSDEARELDDNIDAFFQKNPPNVIWEDPSEDRLRVLQSIHPKNLKRYRKLNTPEEFEAIYPESRDDLNTLLSSAGMDTILELRNPNKMKAFKDSLTYNTPSVPSGMMRAQDYQNALVDHLSRADTDYHGVNTISKLMYKPGKLLREHPKAEGLILEFAYNVLDDEEIDKIRSMDIPTNEKLSMYSKAAAKEVYHRPEFFTHGTASGDKIRSILGKYMDADPSLKDAVTQNMADFLQNSSPTREEMKLFMNSSNINKGLKAHYAKMLKEQQDRKRVSLFPNGVSPDVLDGVFRKWGAPRIPKKDGTAILTSRLTNETIYPYHLIDQMIGRSRLNDEEAQRIAQERAAEIQAKENVAIKERNEKFGDLSDIQGKVDDRDTPKTPTGAELALMNASASTPDSSKIVEALTLDKPSDYTGEEFEETPEQGTKLDPLGGVVSGYNVRVISGDDDVENTTELEHLGKSVSFEEMLKSANARQWAEKGLPSGCMEATLPAYYRTVTIGSDRDAINVYEHKKMPVGGDGISVKKVPGIGPKMSTKGDE